MADLIGQRASERFAALLNLDEASAAARLELKEAGVSAARITILYPLDFCALLPGVIARFAEQDWDPYTDRRYPSWRSLRANQARLIDNLSGPGLMRLTDALCQRSDEEARRWNQLINLIDPSVDEEEPTLAYAIVEALFEACWFMDNLWAVHSAREAHDYFLDVTGRLLLE